MGVSGEVRGQLAMEFGVLVPHLHERQRRLIMGAGAASRRETRISRHDGIRAVAWAAQVSVTMVRKGKDESEAGEETLGRVRRHGSGRKKTVDLDPGFRPALLALVEPDERGAPDVAAALDGEVDQEPRGRANPSGARGERGHGRGPAV